jgi:hypothetical protein
MQEYFEASRWSYMRVWPDETVPGEDLDCLRCRQRQFGRADVRVIVLSDWLPLLVVVPVIWSVFMGGCTSMPTTQIPPSPEALWQPPDLRQYTNELKRPESPILDREKRYELVELIDIAERVNPETRVV